MRSQFHKAIELSFRIPKYVSVLGYRGVAAWLKIQLSKIRRPGRTRIKLRKGTGCVHIRNNRTDGGTFETVLIDGDYRIGEFKRSKDVNTLYERLLNNGQVPLILDCGAHIGLSALFFSLAYPRSRIVAIEPSKDNIEMLLINCAQRNNIEVVKGAIWSRPDFLKIIDEQSSPTAFQVTPCAENAPGVFRAYSVNSIYEEKGHSFAPFIVKIDIEGAERELFSSNTEWVNKTPVIFAELHDSLFPGLAVSRSFLEAISRYDRDFLCIGQNVVSIQNSIRLGDCTHDAPI